MKLAGIFEPEDEQVINIYNHTQFSRELHSDYVFRKGYEIMMKYEGDYDRS